MKYDILLEKSFRDTEIITVTSKLKAFKIAKIIGINARCMIRETDNGCATVIYDNKEILDIIQDAEAKISRTISEAFDKEVCAIIDTK